MPSVCEEGILVIVGWNQSEGGFTPDGKSSIIQCLGFSKFCKICTSNVS